MTLSSKGTLFPADYDFEYYALLQFIFSTEYQVS